MFAPDADAQLAKIRKQGYTGNVLPFYAPDYVDTDSKNTVLEDTTNA
jgi:hypothetical protein